MVRHGVAWRGVAWHVYVVWHLCCTPVPLATQRAHVQCEHSPCVAGHFSQSVRKNFEGSFEEYDEEYDEACASDLHPPRAQEAWNGDAAFWASGLTNSSKY